MAAKEFPLEIVRPADGEQHVLTSWHGGMPEGRIAYRRAQHMAKRVVPEPAADAPKVAGPSRSGSDKPKRNQRVFLSYSTDGFDQLGKVRARAAAAPYELQTEQGRQRWRGTRDGATEESRLVSLALRPGPDGQPVFECTPLDGAWRGVVSRGAPLTPRLFRELFLIAGCVATARVGRSSAC